MRKPIVALIGRPNVGKSTLFNRLVEQRKAIVEDVPGTTRDRLYGDCEWSGVSFLVVDTGGVELPSGRREEQRSVQTPLAVSSKGFLREIRVQVTEALAEADVIVFVTDAKSGITPADETIAEWLRQSQKPLLVAANKADNEERRLTAFEFYNLGVGEVFAVSALHGIGTGDLLDAIVAGFEQIPAEPEEPGLRLALVGRPNVGKSSLLNALLGRDRAIVSVIPGTTRDAVDSQVKWHGESVTLVDTAGIRRRGHIDRGVERYSVLRALRAIERSDVVALLVDAEEGNTEQDAHIAGYALESSRSIFIVVNKWDLVEKDSYTMDVYRQRLREAFRFIDYVPLIFISALTKQRVGQVLEIAHQVYSERFFRIPTSALNHMLEQAVARHPQPVRAGKQLRFYYVTQADVDPPTFVFFVNNREIVHFSYKRYLENSIRALHPFHGTPLRLVFRNRSGDDLS